LDNTGEPENTPASPPPAAASPEIAKAVPAIDEQLADATNETEA
jgi:hypothetical protein